MATTTPSDSHATAARERTVVNRWVALAIGLLAVAVMFAIAYLHASTALSVSRDASLAARETANCVNTILATRASVTQADADAQRQFFDESARLTRSLSAVVSAPPADQPEKFALFVIEAHRAATVTDHTRAVLAAGQAYRNAHPLGRC